MALLQVDPGGEQFVPFAKKKLAQWKAQMRAAGVASWSKVVQVSDGSRIYINSLYLGAGQFRDRIRITVTSALLDFLLVKWDELQLWGVVRNAENTAYEASLVSTLDIPAGEDISAVVFPYDDATRQAGTVQDIMDAGGSISGYPLYQRPTSVTMPSVLAPSSSNTPHAQRGVLYYPRTFTNPRRSGLHDFVSPPGVDEQDAIYSEADTTARV